MSTLQLSIFVIATVVFSCAIMVWALSHLIEKLADAGLSSAMIYATVAIIVVTTITIIGVVASKINI